MTNYSKYMWVLSARPGGVFMKPIGKLEPGSLLLPWLQQSIINAVRGPGHRPETSFRRRKKCL